MSFSKCRRVASVSVNACLFTLAALLIAAPCQAIQRPKSHVPTFTIADQQDLAESVLADVVHRVAEQRDEHFHKGEYNHNVNLARVQVQAVPGDLDAYADAAYLLWSMTRSDDAVAFLKQGLAANPNSYYMYDEIGQHYLYRVKDPVSALPYYEKAVKFRCPALTWHGLAHCYERTNQWIRAVDAWQSAAQYPGDRVAEVNLRRARAHAAARKGSAPPSSGGAKGQ